MKELLFVRYYGTAPTEDRSRDLSLRHLVWETTQHGQGRRRKTQPHYAVVECRCVLRRVSISPHFAHWDEGADTHFLVNNLLDLWPADGMLPKQPFLQDPPACRHASNAQHIQLGKRKR